MKFAFICCTQAWGGLELNTLNFAKWLQDAGVPIILICFPDSRLWYEACAMRLEVRPINHINKKKYFNFKAAFQINKIIKQENASNLVIAHYEQHITCVWVKLFSSIKVKLIYIQQMQINHSKKNLFHNFFFKAIDLWFTPLEYLKNDLFEKTNLKENQISILPLCTDTAKFNEADEINLSFRESILFAKDDFVCGVIGRIDKAKGQEYLLKALLILKYRNINIKIIIVGEETKGGNGYKIFLLDFIKKNKLEGSVVFMPFKKNVIEVFQSLDLFVMCSKSEPIGMVTIEALLCKVPVIGTNRGGTKEVLADGKYGKLIEPNDELALADAIEEVIINYSNFKNMAIQASEVYKNNYSKEKWVKGFLEKTMSI